MGVPITFSDAQRGCAAAGAVGRPGQRARLRRVARIRSRRRRAAAGRRASSDRHDDAMPCDATTPLRAFRLAVGARIAVVVVSWPSCRSKSSAPRVCASLCEAARSRRLPPTRISKPSIFPSRLRQPGRCRHSPDGCRTRRASSFPEHRTRTTSASSICASLCAGAWRRRSRPLCCSICCSRTARTCGTTTRRARALCSTSWPRLSRPDSRLLDDLRQEIARTNAARAAARRLVGTSPRRTARQRAPRSFRCSAHSGSWRRTTTRRSPARLRTQIATRPPLDGPRVLLAGAPVDGPALHAAIESHGAVVVAEVGPWGSGAAGDDVRMRRRPGTALADKYRRRRDRPAHTRRLRCAARSKRMLDQVDAVVVSLPPDDAAFGWDYPALRDCWRRDAFRTPVFAAIRIRPPTPADHARLDALVTAAAARTEARHG